MRSVFLSSTCAIALVAAFSSEAYAQTNDGEASAGPASTEIVVTAQRRAQNVQSVPISISVASGATLRKEDIRNLSELATREPDINISTGPASDQLHIRGIGSGFNPGFVQSVATFVDDVYRARSRESEIGLFDVDNVEILKGPQTTFFGANAIAGALNIITRKPTPIFQADATALYAPTDGEYDLEGGVSGPLTDTLSARLALKISGMNGYIHNEKLDNEGPHLDDEQGRLSLSWKPSSNFSVDARFDASNNDDKGIFDGGLLNCPPVSSAPAGLCKAALAKFGSLNDTVSENSNAGPSDLKMNLYEAVVTPRLKLGDYTLISTTAYSYENVSELIGLGAPYPGLSVNGTLGFFDNTLAEQYKQISQEIRLESPTDRTFSFILGGYYQYDQLATQSLNGFFFANFSPFLPIGSPSTLAAADGVVGQITNTASIFGAGTLNLTKTLRLNVGLRYSDVRIDANRTALVGSVDKNNDLSSFSATGVPQAPLGKVLGAELGNFPVPQIEETKLMPSVNLEYDVASNILVYAGYTSGFKAGGFSGGTTDIFGPETVDDFELGAKASWLDRRLTTDLALFDSFYKNLQETTNVFLGSGVILSEVANVGAVNSRGVEFDGRFQATDALSFTADVAFLDAKFTKFPSAPCTPLAAAASATCVVNLAGKPLPYAPSWSGSVGAEYEQFVTSQYKIRLGAIARFTSGYYEQTFIDPLVYQPAFAKIDLRAGIGPENDRWEFAVIAKNVTNVITTSFRGFATASAGSAVFFPDPPFSLALQVTAKW